MNKYKIIGMKTIGFSHLESSKPCQDSYITYSSSSFKLISVSDGHGGNDYCRSEKGSKFAVETIRDILINSYSNKAVPDNSPSKEKSRNLHEAILDCSSESEVYTLLKLLVARFLHRWKQRIEDDYSQNPFLESELAMVSEPLKKDYQAGNRLEIAYGATFLMSVVTDDYIFCIQIGDGDCVAFTKDGKAVMPIPEDSKCIGNMTTSLCDGNALDEARFFFSKDFPASIFLSTDGVGKSFKQDKDLLDFYKNVSFQFSDNEEAAKELEEYIPRMSKNGSGDDIAIVGLLDIEMIKNNKEKFARKKEKYIKVLRIGNRGAKSIEQDYCQSARFLITEDTKFLDLKSQFCNGFGEGPSSIDILQIKEDGIVIAINGKEYKLTECDCIDTYMTYKKEKDKKSDLIMVRYYSK